MRHLIIATVFLCTSLCLRAQFQGLVLNEVASNYIELVVVGKRTCYDSTVNLAGWIIDDNNGWFGSGPGKGISPGHFRFAPNSWPAVPFGSIIVIYKEGSRPSIPYSDGLNTNPDGCVYVFSTNSGYFEEDQWDPGIDYGLTNYAYPNPVLWAVNPLVQLLYYPTSNWAAWSCINLNPTGDAVVIVNPAASYSAPYFSFAWGTATGGITPSVYKPQNLGSVFYLQGDNFADANSWKSGLPSDQTPGRPNDNQDNKNWILSMQEKVRLPILQVNDPAAVCAPSTVDITSPSVTAGSYFFNAASLTYWQDAAATQPLTNPQAIASSGTYYIKATNDATQICFVIKPVKVTVKISPKPDVDVQNTCSGYTILFVKNQDQNGTLQWSNGEAANPLNVLDPGSYTVIQTVNGCTSEQTTVTATPGHKPVTPSITVTNNCNGTSTLMANGIEQGADILWSNGTNRNPLTVPSGGTFTVSQTLNNCPSLSSTIASTVTLTYPAVPAISLIHPTCIAPNGKISLGPGTAGLEFSLDGSAFTSYPASGFVVNAGNHMLAVRSVGGSCVTTTSIVINSAPNAPATPTFTLTQPTCTIATGSLVLTSPTAGFDFSLDGGAFTPYPSTGYTVSAGSHSLTLRNNTGCVTSIDVVINQPPTTPAQPIASVIDNCDGTSTLTASNYSGTLLWSNGATTATVTVNTSGNYSVTQSLSGCTSAASNVVTASPKATPPAPTASVVDNCNNTSVLSVSGVVNGGTILWSNGNTSNSVIVNTSGSYSVTQSLNGCISAPSAITASPKNSPPVPTITVSDNCNGTSVLTPGGIVNGASVLWSNGSTGSTLTVNTSGNYSIAQTVSGCTSTSTTVTASPKNTPAAPVVNVTDNCDGTSTLTASNYLGNLTWSDGSTTNAITVTSPGSYSVFQTVNGCSGQPSATVTASPKTVPPSPVLTGINNCNATTVLNASGIINGAALLWSNGATTSSTIVNTAGTYSLVQTVNGCASTPASITASPAASLSSPVINVVDNCNGTSVLTATGLVNGATLSWSNGAVSNPITVTTSGSYSVIQSMSGCTSAPSVAVNASPRTTPPALIVNVTDNCDGTSVLTASGITNGASVLWSNGSTGNSLTVTSPATLSAIQTVNGCTSAASASVTASPKNIPAVPVVNVVDNCDGTSVLTASNYTGSLLWSNGASAGTITVTTAGSYSVSQNINGCISAPASVNAAPKLVPAAPLVNVVDNCNGTSILTASNYSGSLLWSNGSSSAVITVSAQGNYSVTQSLNGCTSAGASVTASPKSIPSSPTVNVIDNCDGTSVLTATNYSGSLLWSNGSTGNSITVNNAGSYSVAQTVNGCTSTNVSATASPRTKPSMPVINVVDNCNGTSVLTAANYTGSLLWSNGSTASSITVNSAGNYSVAQTINGCSSTNAVATAAPRTTPAAPVSLIAQPTCSILVGRVTVTAPMGSGLSYSIDGVNYQGTPAFNNITPGNYNLTVKNNNGCISQPTSVIVNQPISSVVASATAPTIPCEQVTGSIFVSALNGAAPYSYSLNGGQFGTSNVFANLIPGPYQVMAKDANGCITTPVSVVLSRIPAFSFDVNVDKTSVLPGTTVHLNSSASTTYSVVSWSPLNLFPSQSSLSQTIRADSSVNITVIAKSSAGCLDTASISLAVIPIDGLFIPSAFTPNGDGKNDVLRVLGSNIVDLDFRVFNRWGQLVFSSNDPAKGWDGTLAGKAQAPDVFVYVAVAKMKDGKTLTKKGTATLIR